MEPKTKPCPYCTDDSRSCPVTSPVNEPGGPWFCTRPEGHDGPHVACQTRKHNLHTWTD
jgi:hypothetical protein